MPGGDSNPYLVMAAILGAALNGIDDDVAPPPPVMGNAYAQALLKVPTDWDEAIARIETSPRMARVFPKLLIDLLVQVKRQEQKRTATLEHADVAWLCHDRV
jgi:glutamine synthetase